MIWTESYNRPYVADTTTYNIFLTREEHGTKGEEEERRGWEEEGRERERREEEKERERRTQIKLSSS